MKDRVLNVTKIVEISGLTEMLGQNGILNVTSK